MGSVNENPENEEKSEAERPEDTTNTPSYNPTQEKPKPKKEPKRFIPPTLEEVKAYCEERNNNVDAKRFWDYYEAAGWKDQSGKPVKRGRQIADAETIDFVVVKIDSGERAAHSSGNMQTERLRTDLVNPSPPCNRFKPQIGYSVLFIALDSING